MAELEVKNLEQVVVRFSGDSGDGMQLAGNIFSTVSATVGNGISTFLTILPTSAPRKGR
jgi:2-oxoglutarate ferredoxin oxidoreductase subunit alpha